MATGHATELLAEADRLFTEADAAAVRAATWPATTSWSPRAVALVRQANRQLLGHGDRPTADDDHDRPTEPAGLIAPAVRRAARLTRPPRSTELARVCHRASPSVHGSERLRAPSSRGQSMSHVLAAEGGYQIFTLGGLGVVLALLLRRRVASSR